MNTRYCFLISYHQSFALPLITKLNHNIWMMVRLQWLPIPEQGHLQNGAYVQISKGVLAIITRYKGAQDLPSPIQ